MRVWFPDYYTEAHRTDDRKKVLVKAMRDIGVQVVSSPESRCDLCFCGSLFKSRSVRVLNRRRRIPVVYYNWDLYPWVVKNRPVMGWPRFLIDLNTAARILVPNEGTRLRTTELVGRESHVVLSPVSVWQVPPPFDGHPKPGSYVLEVSRDYDWDKGYKYVSDACSLRNEPLLRTACKTPWDEFRWLVANARCLLTGLDEASTGGLTLLEGYAHGVPVVASDSPLNGAREYFGDRATYFDHTGGAAALADAMGNVSRPVSLYDARGWVDAVHSNDVFAANLKREFETCLTTYHSPKT